MPWFVVSDIFNESRDWFAWVVKGHKNKAVIIVVYLASEGRLKARLFDKVARVFEN